MAKEIVKDRIVLILWGSIVMLHILLILNITFFPYPELFIYPYLTKIGLVPYKQIFDQHFPGLMFFPINFATLGITSPQSFRIVQLVLVILSQIALYRVTLKLLKKGSVSIFVAILYMVWQMYFDGGTLWIESMLVPLLIFSFYYLDDAIKTNRLKSYFISGVLIGLALITKQIVIPLSLILGIYLLICKRQHETKIGYWFFGAAIPVFVLLCFVLSRGIEKPFIYWAGTFNITAYHEMGRKFASGKEIVSTLFLAGPAIVAIFMLYLRKKNRSSIFLLSTFFFTGFLYAYARFDYIHLQPVVPFAVILVVWGFCNTKKTRLLGILFLVFSIVVGIRFVDRNYGHSVKFFEPADYEIATEVQKYAKTHESVFAFGTYPYIYALTDTHPAGNVFVFQFPWFMKVTEESILNGLVVDPPVVVVRDITAMIDSYNLIAYMPKINTYINRYYKTVEIVGNTEIMVKQ